ncbi:MAG: TIGR02117 family protein [Sphingosinicella sp.]
MRRPLKWLLRALLALLALPIAWFAAALVLGLVPANPSWREPPPGEGVTIFLRSNGVHTWIVVPKVHQAIDWRPYAPGTHLRDPRWGGASHVGFGYGNREFYLNTPTWGDLSLATAFHAAFGGGPPLLHVEHDHRPQPEEWTRRLRISEDQYQRLSGFIRARFRTDAQGRTLPLLGRGYGANDMFYEANGGYSFWLTCNEWTGKALRHAGIRTGLWTPLAQSLMWRLD